MSLQKTNGENYRSMLKDLVRAAGQEVIDRADDLVGNGDLISSFSITLDFPQDSIPTITVHREHCFDRSIQVMDEHFEKKEKETSIVKSCDNCFFLTNERTCYLNTTVDKPICDGTPCEFWKHWER